MLNNSVTITVDASEAVQIIKRLIIADSFVEAQWVEGLDKNGNEFGKYVTEDVVGFWSDNFRFGDENDPINQDRSTSLAWVISNLPSEGDVRIIYV